MEIKPVSTRMFSLIVLYDMQTDYFKRALDGISGQDAQNRLNTKANHIAWLAGSFIQERFETAKLFGIDQKQAADELFKDHKGIQDGATYPALSEFQKDLDKITPQLRDALMKVTDEKLDEKFEMMPEMQMTYFELFSFMTYREANIIGQIALWRRLLGYPALNYM
jgi:hypothetical protein